MTQSRRRWMLATTLVLIVGVAGFAWQLVHLQESAAQVDEAQLNDREYWPKQSLEPLANVDAYLVTRWFFGRAYFNLRIEGYSRTVEKMKASRDARLILTF